MKASILICIGLGMVAMSCEKVLVIDVEDAAPRIVVEGNVRAGQNHQTVSLNWSNALDEANNFAPVTGASVRIFDDAGQDVLLQASTAGLYTTDSLAGIPGRTYFLEIEAAGERITASSQMPFAVDMDSLYSSSVQFFNATRTPIFVLLSDPAANKNWYRFVTTVSGDRYPGSIVMSDELMAAGQTSVFLQGPGEFIQSGDSVQVEMQCIDLGVFTYFDSFSSLGGGPGGASAAPANPYSNLQGNALGYFNAYSPSFKAILVP